ncbi:MAG: hypothetical protein U9R31_04435 [Candidatus Omnitrophota bacterium]|nr:hypothetical protein [Candidatus Omnitrophota bacterium]
MKNLRTKLAVLILLAGGMFLFLAGQAECGVVLKTMIVNPSKTKTQEALLKAYLPREVKPEDIVELGDLTLDYDIGKALYYVYKKVELAPGESASRSIEIKDVWIISRARIDNLTGDAEEMVKKLKGPAYFDIALTLQKDIQEKSGDILRKQEAAMDVLPQTHIAVYRDNVEILDSIKDILSKLEKMVIESKVVVAGPAAERISVKTTWRVILGVIIVLGLLSLIFFIIWQRQAGIDQAREKEREKEREEK